MPPPEDRELENERLDEFLSDLTDASRTHAEEMQAKREDVRSYVTMGIVVLYAVCIVAYVATAMLELTSSANLETVVTFLHSFLLPIITLVLGFYFASERNN